MDTLKRYGAKALNMLIKRIQAVWDFPLAKRWGLNLMVRPKTKKKASCSLLLFKIFTSDIDGGYSEWTLWSVCSHDCGGGRMKRRRLCVNPPQQENGQFCAGADIQTKTCNTNKCDSESKKNYFKSWVTLLSLEPCLLTYHISSPQNCHLLFMWQQCTFIWNIRSQNKIIVILWYQNHMKLIESMVKTCQYNYFTTRFTTNLNWKPSIIIKKLRLS